MCRCILKMYGLSVMFLVAWLRVSPIVSQCVLAWGSSLTVVEACVLE